MIYQKPVKIGASFTIAYIHSVTNQPVYEQFIIESKNVMTLTEMRYDSFGANLPVGPNKLEKETTEFIVEDGYYLIKYQNRKFNSFLLRVGQVVADHTLIFESDNKLRLQEIVKPGSSVELFVSPLLEFSEGRTVN
ncbi:MAG: DUF1850 domain-containing protein [Bacillota bacterium]|nr:DUF1850 domain-containing protein [Bacillota bacterium]